MTEANLHDREEGVEEGQLGGEEVGRDGLGIAEPWAPPQDRHQPLGDVRHHLYSWQVHSPLQIGWRVNLVLGVEDGFSGAQDFQPSRNVVAIL